MPEAFAIVSVGLVIIATCVVLWLQSRNPALHDPRREQARLETRVLWLQDRLAVARREAWSHEMVGRLAADFSATTERLARLKQQGG